MTSKDDLAILVFTADPLDRILGDSGSGDWVVSPRKANGCKYIVCCRKPNWSNRKDNIPERAAFLVGRVAGLLQRPGSETPRNQLRYFVQMRDYALLTPPQPEAWREDVRNPVAYTTLHELRIDPSKLEFKALSGPRVPVTAADSVARPMTIADAKKGLAAAFGVSPDNIEITIRA